jgi:hypothetical protein
VCLFVGVVSLKIGGLVVTLEVPGSMLSQHFSVFQVLLQWSHGKSEEKLVPKKYNAQAVSVVKGNCCL